MRVIAFFTKNGNLRLDLVIWFFCCTTCLTLVQFDSSYGVSSMRKKPIAILLVIGVILAAIGGVLVGIGAAGMVTVTASGSVQATGTVSPAYLLGAGLAAIGGIFSLVAWIGALVATGKLGRWGWFVLVFLLSGLGVLIYLIGGPSVNSYVPAPNPY